MVKYMAHIYAGITTGVLKAVSLRGNGFITYVLGDLGSHVRGRIYW